MTSSASGPISERFIQRVRRRLVEDRPLRRALPVWGRLAVDRPLPFLCVYRRPVRSRDRATFRLATTEASYLICSGAHAQREGLVRLASCVAETMVEKFGEFLVLEIWAARARIGEERPALGELQPGFKIFAARGGRRELTGTLEEALGRIKIGRERATVGVVEVARRWPRGLQPVLPPGLLSQSEYHYFGIELAPFYFDAASGDPFPWVLRQLRRKLSVAMRRFVFEFSTTATSAEPQHFHALGRRAVVKAVWDVDRILADTGEEYEFLLQLTPVNGEQAWHQFRRGGYQNAPTFRYRPMPIDPVVLKRRLFAAPVEKIEDPALAIIFREKLDELDRQITMLQDRNSDRFLPESVQLYGGVEDELHGLAVEILDRIPPRSREAAATGIVDAEAFAVRAREEVEYLRRQHPEVTARVEVRPDVTGLLVSRGNLLVSSRSRIPASRVEALIQHEVGTHVLTYHNGRAQKLHHMAVGLAGYDALQEGLAVLSEYLVGGLSRPRLRLLAGRVVAVRCLVDGASFLETYRELTQTYGFAGRTAFSVTVRTHRAGGLTKDAVYLRGLQQILEYLGRGGALEPLFVGKIAVQHIPIVRELTVRGVLMPPPLVPRYMEQIDATKRLQILARGARVVDLMKGPK